MTKQKQKDKVKLWVTRPALDAPNQQKILQDNGYETVCFSLLDIKIHKKEVDTSNCQAVIFTSANGIRAFVQNKGDLSLPAYAVGEATRQQALEYGFKSVVSANGDINDLSDTIKENLNPNNGVLYHSAGSIVAKDLGALLDSFGYSVRRVPLYDALPCDHISEDMQKSIKNQEIQGVLLMSPRIADIFVRLMRTYGLDKYVQSMVIFSLSDAVASKCSGFGADIVVAKTPTNDSLMQKINDYFQN